MKNLLFTFSLTLFSGWVTHAQNIFFCGYGEAVLPSDICNVVNGNAFANNEEAEQAVDRVLKKLGLPRNFAMAQCPDIENCVAVTGQNGVRYIVYDKEFVQRIKSRTSDWSALSILAHEIGHHLAGHTNTGAADLAESRKFELEADYFTGYQMYRMGATLSQAQQAVRLVASERDDRFSSHPKLSKRLAAIAEGYNAAKAESGGGSDEPGPPAPAPIIEDLPDMKYVQGGSFEMGSRKFGESPIHEVTLSNFYIGIYEVTFDEYDAYCDATGKGRPNDAGYGRGKRPVINVSWYDALEYCNWRSEQAGLQKVYDIIRNQTDPNNQCEVDDLKWLVIANWDANGYRLPTEAEWEFAARSRGKDEIWAGTSTEKKLDAYANFSSINGESRDKYEYTAPVGSFRANDLGLYDMSGNISEWCWDWYETYYYKSSPQQNPLGPESGSTKITRGGECTDGPGHLRCAHRGYLNFPNHESRFRGFRLVRSAH